MAFPLIAGLKVAAAAVLGAVAGHEAIKAKDDTVLWNEADQKADAARQFSDQYDAVTESRADESTPTLRKSFWLHDGTEAMRNKFVLIDVDDSESLTPGDYILSPEMNMRSNKASRLSRVSSAPSHNSSLQITPLTTPEHEEAHRTVEYLQAASAHEAEESRQRAMQSTMVRRSSAFFILGDITYGMGSLLKEASSSIMSYFD